MIELHGATSDARKQSIRFRRTLMSIIGAFCHTLVCFLLLDMGFFRMSFANFVILFSVFWLVDFSFLLLIVFGWNKVFSDPSMTLMEVVWAVTCVMITVYFTDQMRAVVLMFVILVLAFGAFRLTQKQFFGVILYATLNYVLILFLLSQNHPSEVVLKEEIVVLPAFVCVCSMFAMVAYEMSSIRKHLQQQKIMLKIALQDVSRASMTDELTGVKNRRYILGILDQLRETVERQKGYYFSIIMIDIDFFKKINDRYGHAIGDKLLNFICRVIENNLRGMDFFSRIGGEEFLIVAPFCDAISAKMIAERICRGIEKADFKNIMLDDTVTVSAGVVMYQWPESIAETLIRVDKAMYEAKEKGRNRVIIAT